MCTVEASAVRLVPEADSASESNNTKVRESGLSSPPPITPTSFTMLTTDCACATSSKYLQINSE